MNVVSANNPNNLKTCGLSPLNPNAFAKMVAYGHRLVSIEQETGTKFRVNTECTSGVRDYNHSTCKGFMQFKLSEAGINLYLGKFEHSKECAEKSGSIPAVIEDIESSDASWQEALANAKAIAGSELENEQNKRRQVVQSDYDYPCTPHAVYAASKVLTSIEKLESLLEAFYKKY